MTRHVTLHFNSYVGHTGLSVGKVWLPCLTSGDLYMWQREGGFLCVHVVAVILYCQKNIDNFIYRREYSSKLNSLDKRSSAR